jgi:hypothetical protein
VTPNVTSKETARLSDMFLSVRAAGAAYASEMEDVITALD